MKIKYSPLKLRRENRSASEAEWAEKKCISLKGVKPKKKSEIREVLRKLSGWHYIKGEIVKTFKFADYYETVAFLNAVAWIANQENHHPEIELSYKTCVIRYSTHSIGGISDNDFICAAEINFLNGTE